MHVHHQILSGYFPVGTERVTSWKARGLQKKEIGCKCQTFFISLLKRQAETNYKRQIFGFPDSSFGKNPPAMQETLVRFLGWEDPLEKG